MMILSTLVIIFAPLTLVHVMIAIYVRFVVTFFFIYTTYYSRLAGILRPSFGALAHVR